MLTFDPIEHQYFWNGEPVPGCNEIGKSLGLIDDTFMTPEGAERGKRRHALLDDYDRGELDWTTVSPEDEHVLVGWQEFRDEMEFQPTAIELPVYHPNLGVAGTIDRVGENLVIDIKTGSSLHLWYDLQVAIYGLAYAATMGVTVPRLGICHIRKAKKQQYRYVEVPQATVDSAFSVIETYWWQRKDRARIDMLYQWKVDWLEDLAKELGDALGQDIDTSECAE